MKSISHKILAAILMVFMVVGCSKNYADGEVDPDPSTGGDTPSIGGGDSIDSGAISFSSSVLWDQESASSTKGNSIIDDFEVGDNIGVYAYHIPEGETINTGEVKPNFMYNQLVEKQSSTTWVYTPIKYWSSNSNDVYTFFSYSPHSSGEEDTKYYEQEGEYGFPIFVHDTPALMVDTKDFVLAGRKCTKDIGVVNLKYEHVLSRLRFEFCNKLYSTRYKMLIRSLALINVTTNSAFTYREMSDQEIEDAEAEAEANGEVPDVTGMLLVEYIEEGVESFNVGTVTADIDSGALIGGTQDENGLYDDSAYISASWTEDNDGFVTYYDEYTDITVDGEYMFLDPNVVSSEIMLKVDIEIYAEDEGSDETAGEYVGKTLMVSNELYVDVTDIVGNMERGGSYIWQLSYQPSMSSSLIVYVIDFWEDVYNKHDL